MLSVKLSNLGNTAILYLRGRIVRGETESLRETVNSQTGVAVVVIDLGGVNTIDASGLGLLLELRQQTQSKGMEFRIRHVTRLVRQVLEITRLNSVFEVPVETAAPLISLCGRSSALRAIAACV